MLLFFLLIIYLLISLFTYAFAIFLPISIISGKIDKKSNLAILVYNKCEENNITDFKSDKNKEKLELLASSCHISDISELERLYNKGKNILIERKKAEKLNIINSCRNTEINEYRESEKLLKFIGKEKYLLEKIYNNTYYTIKYKDNFYSRPTKIYHNLDQKICDHTNIEEKAELIEISNVILKKTAGFNIKVNANIKVKSNPTIFNSNAILDGTFKATIYNQVNEKIGQGYFSAPGFGAGHCNYYNDDVGFNSITTMDFMCYISDPKNLEDDIDTYTCEIESINLWLIENFFYKYDN